MSNPNKNTDKSKKNKAQNKKGQNKNEGSKGAEKPGNKSGLGNLQPKEVKFKGGGAPAPKNDPLHIPKDDVVLSHNVRGKYSKRRIESISRVELPDDIYDTVEESSRGANLHELFNRPIPKGDHFQFKSEKNWEGESKHLDRSDLFSLDFQKLSEHIACIPFYKLAGLDTALFSEKQIASMNQNAEECQKKYSMKDSGLSIKVSDELKKMESSLKDFIIDDSFSQKKTENTISDRPKSEVPKEENKPKPDITDELDDLLQPIKCNVSPQLLAGNANEISPRLDVSRKSTSLEKENLEDWLDEYLDS